MTRLRALLGRLGHPLVLLVLLAGLWVWIGELRLGTVQIISFTLINVMLAQSMNLLTGMAGQISLGHAGFFGFGAYGSALAMTKLGLPFAAAVPFGAGVAAFAGLLLSIPAGRVKEFYLAMMTLGFGMIFYEVLKEWTVLTGGVMGLPGVPSPQLRTLQILGLPVDAFDYCRLLLAVAVVVLVLLHHYARSYRGRACFAVKVSEIAAGSIGIDGAAVRREAYVLSAGIAGLAGGLYAHLVGYLGPDSFGLGRSIEILVMAVVGGLGTLAGPVLGAILFTWLPERLQVFSEYQYMVYGVILIFAFTAMPRGLAGLLLPAARFVKARALRSGPRAELPMPERAPPGRPILEIEGLSKHFGGLAAVESVSFSLHPGRITALVGPNGSGKSTLVNVVSGIYRPTAGEVRLAGERISGLADHAIARRGLVRIFQDPRLVPGFTVRENVLLGAHRVFAAGLPAVSTDLPRALREERALVARADAALARAGLDEVADREIEGLPYGTRRLVEIARALVAEPQVILLDEPAAGLSEPEMQRLGGLIRALRAEGRAVLVIEHHMDFLAGLADEVVVLDSGQEIYRGDMAGMRQDPAVRAAYFGARDLAHA